MLLWRAALGRAVWRAAFGHVGSAYSRTMIRGVFGVVKGGFRSVLHPTTIVPGNPHVRGASMSIPHTTQGEAEPIVWKWLTGKA